jgi:integrase
MRDGKQRRKIFEQKKPAIAWEDSMLKVSLVEFKNRVKLEYTINEWIADFMEGSSKQFASDITIKEYLRTFSRLLAVTIRYDKVWYYIYENDERMFPLTMPVGDIQREEVRRFMLFLRDALGNKVANRARAKLHAAYEWGIENHSRHFGDQNPFHVKRGGKFAEDMNVRVVPTVEEFWELYHKLTRPEQRFMLTYFALAARRKEVLRIKRHEVDFDNHCVRLWTRKRSGGAWEYDDVAIKPAFEDVLREQFASHEGEHLFVKSQASLQPYSCRSHFFRYKCLQHGIRAFNYHAIRHFAASLMAREGVPMQEIQMVLRHKSMATTELYIGKLRRMSGAVTVLEDFVKDKPELKTALRVISRA